MSKKTSREIALERRKAMSDSGKKAAAYSSTTKDRVRSSHDIQISGTQSSSNNQNITLGSFASRQYDNDYSDLIKANKLPSVLTRVGGGYIDVYYHSANVEKIRKSRLPRRGRYK